NGLSFFPDYEGWAIVSLTDRFDNATLRVITGNDTAVKAIADGNVHPWPDGTAFAKIAWTVGPDGRATAFKQVEFMVKDARRYSETEGWGWGRWLGTGLVPYGEADLARECTGCHAPMRDNDYVYSLPFESPPASERVFNTQAALPDGLPQRAVSAWIDGDAF